MKALSCRSKSILQAIVLNVVIALSFCTASQAQQGGSGADSTIIFQSSEPLLQSKQEQARIFPNTWGFDASFSDYGFGGGLYLSHRYSEDFTAGISADLGTAKGSREFSESDQKINRIFVAPVMLYGQYRLFSESLTDNLRPFATAGAGPVVALTTPAQQEFFSAFGKTQAKIVPGGFVGVGANFGIEKRSMFGAQVRYFIIPYPGSIQSTSTQALTDLSGLFLTVNYGFRF